MKTKNLMVLVARKSSMAFFLGLASTLALLVPSKASAAVWFEITNNTTVSFPGWTTIPGTGGAQFVGNVQNVNTPTSDTVIFTGGALMNPTAGPLTGNFEIDSPYNFTGGGGVSIAYLDVTLINSTPIGPGPVVNLLVGGEAVSLESFGTTFNNNTATAVWSDPGNVAGTFSYHITGYNAREGWYYTGAGIHKNIYSFTLGPGEEIVLPSSTEGALLVPEPASISLLGLGALALLWRRRS